MPVDIDDVMKLLSTLSQEVDLKVTVKESARGGVIAGVTTAVGGVFLGPIGFAVGGALGGLMAYYFSKGKFMPAHEVIMNMEKEKQLELYNDAMTILNKLSYTDAMMLMTVVTGDIVVKEQLVGVVVSHLKDRMKLSIVD